MKREKLNKPERPDKPDRPDTEVKMGKILSFKLPRPQWERAGPEFISGVKIGVFLLIAGLCLGQFIDHGMDQRFPQPIPHNMDAKSFTQGRNLALRQFSYHYNQGQFNTMIITQVESDSLHRKIPLWKTVASYGSEYVAGATGSALIYCLTYIEFYRAGEEYEPWRYPIKFSLINLAGDIVISTSLIWGVGRLWGKKGSIIKTSIGVGLGSFIGSSAEYIWGKCDNEWMVPRFIIPFTSSLGGVIGFNR